MKIITTIFSLIFLFIFLSSCKKEQPKSNDCTDPDFPAITQQGNNTIACFVYNEKFVNCGTTSDFSGFSSRPNYSIQYNSLTKSLTVYAVQNSIVNQSVRKSLSFYIEGLDTLGLYKTPSHKVDFQYNNYNNGRTFITDSDHSGWMKMTRIDTINKIFCGEFGFNAIEQKYTTDFVNHPRKIIGVTNGFFDVKSP